jgi:2-oxo-4-hydroxy-4-carboxy-5-ureidoimidazoline decarboxylase
MEPWQRLDSASPDEARRLLFLCCGSSRWVELMLTRRPFGSTDRLLAEAGEAWRLASAQDWKEAFSHHPRIGDRRARHARFAATRHLSRAEQAGVSAAPPQLVDELASANAAYEARFGYVFIVCATGRSAEEMLSLLRARLRNDPATEIEVAAGEQARITSLRLKAIE